MRTVRTIAEDRVLETDTRLRDVLRSLSPSATRGPLRSPLRPGLELPPPSPLDDTRHAVEVAALAEADLIRLQRRVDDLRQRVDAIDRRRRLRADRRRRS